VIEMHRDALHAGQRVLIHDDLLATGGTAEAAARLVKASGAELAGFSFLIELSYLNGRKKLTPYNDAISTFVTY
jgi:adenine phosphoribosyltransferase